MFLHALHINCFTLLGQFSPQIKDQNSFYFFGFDASPPFKLPLCSSNQLQAILYPLLTVNLPFWVHAQNKESSGKERLIGILRMASDLKGRNMLLTRFLFQPPATRSRKDSTMVPLNSWGRGLTTLKDFGVGNHLSAHILTLCPFPMLHRSPLLRTFLLTSKLLYVYDGFGPS